LRKAARTVCPRLEQGKFRDCYRIATAGWNPIRLGSIDAGRQDGAVGIDAPIVARVDTACPLDPLFQRPLSMFL